MERTWKVLARHKWVLGCTVTESVNEQKASVDATFRRFTATIRGRKGFVIYEGDARLITTEWIINKVTELREAIDAGITTFQQRNVQSIGRG